MVRVRGVPAVLVLLVSAAGAASGQEPSVRLSPEGPDGVAVRWEPAPAAPPAARWHLYRGDLAGVGGDGHRGDPAGRCNLPGDAREVVLAGEATLPGDFYYVLSWVAEDGTESTLGFASTGSERPNAHPCPPPPSDCPDGGTPVSPGVDWDALNGTRPPALLPVPDFAAVNLDGTPRGREDLVGHPTVVWFYPAAGTSG